MKEYNPKNLEELLVIKSQIRFDGISPYLAFFRGQNADWEIKPGVSRGTENDSKKLLINENALFEKFEEEAKSFLNLQPHLNKKEYKFAQKWYHLFQAQHIGIKTRLTDWTQSFENALVFLIYDRENQNIDKNGVLWFYKAPRNLLINFNNEENYKFWNQDPFILDKFYTIKHSSQFTDDYFKSPAEIKRFRQDGSFIISPSNRISTAIEKVDYLNKDLEKIIISPVLKKILKENYLSPNLEDYIFDMQSQEKIDSLKEISLEVSALNSKFF